MLIIQRQNCQRAEPVYLAESNGGYCSGKIVEYFAATILVVSFLVFVNMQRQNCQRAVVIYRPIRSKICYSFQTYNKIHRSIVIVVCLIYRGISSGKIFKGPVYFNELTSSGRGYCSAKIA